MKLLLLDIETSPELAYVWKFWKENIGINQVKENGTVLCWSAKWYGDPTMYFDSVYKSNPKTMLKRIYKLISAADAVIHYNGTDFDMPTLNREFLLHNMLPPAPVKQIDLLVTVRKQFRFPSNKLDYVARRLGVGKKTDGHDFELWLGCMRGDPASWAKMQEYNENDVILLEDVYNRIKPWVFNHPNMAVHDGLVDACPKCGSTHLQRRGWAFTKVTKYQRYVCMDCGSWLRKAKRDASTLDINDRFNLEG